MAKKRRPKVKFDASFNFGANAAPKKGGKKGGRKGRKPKVSGGKRKSNPWAAGGGS